MRVRSDKSPALPPSLGQTGKTFPRKAATSGVAAIDTVQSVDARSQESGTSLLGLIDSAASMESMNRAHSLDPDRVRALLDLDDDLF